MTVTEARAIAQSDPVPVLVERWGAAVVTARKKVAALEDSLRDLDTVTAQLAEHDLVVATDLGPTGNSARSAWQAAELDKTGDTFRLHRGIA